MPIDTISQTISTIPEAGHRGIDVQTQFVIKQEDFQDHLQGTTVSELNALKTQINTTVTGMNIAVENVNTKASEASASASSASTSANTATTKASEASTSASNANVYSLKAGKWADNNYNVEVEAGKYSAKHWATVASNAISGFPAFYAGSSSSQSFTGSVWAKLACNTEVYDNTSNYDTSTYRFTPNKAGKYLVTVRMQSNSGNTGGGIAIYKNGSLYTKLQALNGTTIGDTFTGSYIVPLNGTTDYVEAYGTWNNNNSAVSGFDAVYIVGV